MSSLTLKINCLPCYLQKLRLFPSCSAGMGIMLDQPSITTSCLFYFSGLIITQRLPLILASKKITLATAYKCTVTHLVACDAQYHARKSLMKKKISLPYAGFDGDKT